ncbi:MAG: type I-U CRISPR-associated helicase/endonuclease Cas3, partial [Planctomycetota bacterium]|nr:type I-U CRISPR-associated helicase/endonuclease Cas3 [Planctomycetota bacterium]
MTTHPELPVNLFDDFFSQLHDHSPFQWQTRLAERVCRGDWPRGIKLPTSSGKTSCLEIAIFSLAHQAWRQHTDGIPISAPRRIFFFVDRRIVVNEAFQRAERIRDRLEQASDGVLAIVKHWLQSLAGSTDAPPLDCFELRGGIYRDDAWVRSPLQPTVLASTVDQIGSRLLFRGYGVSDRNLSIHAALAANDSLILLDEAHCSKPFSQTLEAIARYRDAFLEADESPRWATEPIRTPFEFVEMTATPRAGSDADVFGLVDGDYTADTQLKERHACAKPIRLVSSNAKGGQQNAQLAKKLVEEVEGLARGDDGFEPCRRIAIVVNRVDCARSAFALLEKKHPGRVELMIGRMRPIDRDKLTMKLQERFRTGCKESLTEPHFVVATQCLEVGADFDFDGMVTQCASLDALRQRFGRLNRLGKTDHARGAIVMADGDRAPRKPDPIYGESLPATWQWLSDENHQSSEGVVDFGVIAMDALIERSREDSVESAESIEKLSAPSPDAPVLMPAHLDILCQTSPRPALEPDIAAYLHGPNRGLPEVRVCWRADLPERSSYRKTEEWLEACRQTLAVCPPSTVECLSVPLPLFRNWLQGLEQKQADDSGDVLGEAVPEENDGTGGSSKSDRVVSPLHRYGVVWTGRTCQAASARTSSQGKRQRRSSDQSEEPDAVRPNSLVVLPVSAGGWSSLGHLPDAPPEPVHTPVEAAPGRLPLRQPGHAESLSDDRATKVTVSSQQRELARIDAGSEAFKRIRNRDILRVHRNLITCNADCAALSGLWKYLASDHADNLPWSSDALRIRDEDDVDPFAPAIDGESDDGVGVDNTNHLAVTRAALATVPIKRAPMVRYPGGFVVTGPRLTTAQQLRRELPRPSFDDDFDEQNVDADRQVSLSDHLADVAEVTGQFCQRLGIETALQAALVAAAERHDLGKADPRFQALLRGSSLNMAYMQPRLWAKSASGAAARSLNDSAGNDSGSTGADVLPKGFRHEMLSLELARQIQADLDDAGRDVMQHAIAAHHGHARPLAPVVFDETPPDVSLDRLFESGDARLAVRLTAEQRLASPAHRLDSGISERFWKLNRRFGWWGLAWLESTLRLADWVASAQPRELLPRVLDARPATPDVPNSREHRLSFPGLNGANPLGFLAALGLFRHVATLQDPDVQCHWEISG